MTIKFSNLDDEHLFEESVITFLTKNSQLFPRVQQEQVQFDLEQAINDPEHQLSWEYAREVNNIYKLEQNLRSIIEHNNRDILEKSGSATLSDKEFNLIKEYIFNEIYGSEAKRTSEIPVNTAIFLRGVGGISEYTSLKRTLPDGTDKEISLILFASPQLSANAKAKYPQYQVHYQILRQFNYKDYTFDLVLLINGFPLILIENKRARTKRDLKDQLQRYLRSFNTNNQDLFLTTQVLVGLTPTTAMYFARPSDKIKDSFIFKWTVPNNIETPMKYGDLEIPQGIEVESKNSLNFLASFLNPKSAHELISNYIVTVKNDHNSYIMVMRKYQTEAVRITLDRIEQMLRNLDQNNKFNQLKYTADKQHLEVDYNHNPHESVTNLLGYVWHTTGSGKTVTSFKIASLAKELDNIDKVVFVVDRKDLDSQTVASFKSYLATSADEAKSSHVRGVRTSEKTQSLIENLNDNSKDIIITTIQKLGRVFNQASSAQQENIRHKNILFIVDEAHRSTSGQTLEQVRKEFKYTAWVGFTGTPNFNASDKNSDSIFGERIHSYTIAQAIYDKSVLGFNALFTNVTTQEIENEHYDDELIQKLREHFGKDKVDQIYINEHEIDPQKLESMLDDFYEYHIKKDSAFAKNRIVTVVKEILNKWDRLTQNRKFNGMITTSSIKNAIRIFFELKKQNEKLKKPLRFTTLFSDFNLNRTQTLDDDEIDFESKEFNPHEKIKLNLEQGDIEYGYDQIRAIILEHYNRTFNTNVSSDTFEADVYKRIKRSTFDPAKSAEENQNSYLDIVIVVDKMLTGFDAPQLNTLIVDRVLSGAKLIQAYSRTNRIYNADKAYGNIVNVRLPVRNRKNLIEALKIYANMSYKELEASNIITPTPEEIAERIHAELNKFKQKYKVESIVQLDPDGLDDEQVRDIVRITNRLGTNVTLLKTQPAVVNSEGQVIEGYSEEFADQSFANVGLISEDYYNSNWNPSICGEPFKLKLQEIRKQQEDKGKALEDDNLINSFNLVMRSTREGDTNRHLQIDNNYLFNLLNKILADTPATEVPQVYLEQLRKDSQLLHNKDSLQIARILSDHPQRACELIDQLQKDGNYKQAISSFLNREAEYGLDKFFKKYQIKNQEEREKLETKLKETILNDRSIAKLDNLTKNSDVNAFLVALKKNSPRNRLLSNTNTDNFNSDLKVIINRIYNLDGANNLETMRDEIFNKPAK
ncbi:type I restriction enzyme subunit R domain-containing protein [Psittacicella gerlachiana]|uniref:Helicase ATP-binding domain-containing protein n=1 Tax=Psittacicella gerlachiana TaxID=2028574 RepID=A0A3A1Y8R9_9GAMM|nr:DEAD/DEAH box helicase family protein [Psittacicella gerlachiana]RIY33716.1 hypothetical protein CKF59_06225 [Psittacicella gerlachiana]